MGKSFLLTACDFLVVLQTPGRWVWHQLCPHTHRPHSWGKKLEPRDLKSVSLPHGHHGAEQGLRPGFMVCDITQLNRKTHNTGTPTKAAGPLGVQGGTFMATSPGGAPGASHQPTPVVTGSLLCYGPRCGVEGRASEVTKTPVMILVYFCVQAQLERLRGLGPP